MSNLTKIPRLSEAMSPRELIDGEARGFIWQRRQAFWIPLFVTQPKPDSPLMNSICRCMRCDSAMSPLVLTLKWEGVDYQVCPTTRFCELCAEEEEYYIEQARLAKERARAERETNQTAREGKGE